MALSNPVCTGVLHPLTSQRSAENARVSPATHVQSTEAPAPLQWQCRHRFPRSFPGRRLITWPNPVFCPPRPNERVQRRLRETGAFEQIGSEYGRDGLSILIFARQTIWKSSYCRAGGGTLNNHESFNQCGSAINRSPADHGCKSDTQLGNRSRPLPQPSAFGVRGP